jgi:hypothetical protein
MNLRTLYVSKLAKCTLICLADLAVDPETHSPHSLKRKRRAQSAQPIAAKPKPTRKRKAHEAPMAKSGLKLKLKAA